MKTLTVRFGRSAMDSMIVGSLSEADRRIYFEYDAEFLGQNLQFSPFKLALRSGLIEHVDRSFGALPGLFDDSLPDGWGLLLMERMFRRRGIDAASISPLEGLAYLGTRTMGALTYHPPADVACDDRIISLHEIGKNAQHFRTFPDIDPTWRAKNEGRSGRSDIDFRAIGQSAPVPYPWLLNPFGLHAPCTSRRACRTLRSTMMTQLPIQPFTRPFDIRMSPPGSKSLTNRALVLAALGDGLSELSNVLFADDTLVMLENLGKLGFSPQIDRESRSVRVNGRGGEIPASCGELFCGNSGTTLRFLTALCALGRGSFTLDGIQRMRQRPIGPLLELLGNLGVRTRCEMSDGYPPVTVLADRLPGGRCRFGTSTSSQFLSALLQVAPYARHEVRVDLDTPQTSWPYVAMTMRLMDEFHHTPELIRDPSTGDPKEIIIPIGVYRATKYAIEPDASNASYFLAAAAIHAGSKITIEGLGKRSLQGDVGFADVLRRMGAAVNDGNDFISVIGPDRLEAIDVDLSAMPDTAQTLAVAALFADGETTIRGLHTLRVKETDRIAALANELTKLGAQIRIDGDDLSIVPPKQLRPASIATYDDHRMAMSFALAGTKAAGVVIEDPACVNKTYPTFFDDLVRLRDYR